MQDKKNILILEDDISVANILSLIIKKLGYNLMHLFSVNRALELEDTSHCPISNADLIITDFDMIGENALPLLQYIKDQNLTVPVIMYSGNTSVKAIIKDKGFTNIVSVFINKAVSVNEIRNNIIHLLNKEN